MKMELLIEPADPTGEIEAQLEALLAKCRANIQFLDDLEARFRQAEKLLVELSEGPTPQHSPEQVAALVARLAELPILKLP